MKSKGLKTIFKQSKSQASILLIVSSVFFANGVFGNASKEMMDYFEKELTTLENAIQEEIANSPRENYSLTAQTEPDQQWYFQNFWLRFRPRVGFKIPGLLTFQVVLEIQVLWRRDPPDGWTPYRPPNPEPKA